MKMRLHTGEPQEGNRLKRIPTKHQKWQRRFYYMIGLNSLTLLLLMLALYRVI